MALSVNIPALRYSRRMILFAACFLLTIIYLSLPSRENSPATEHSLSQSADGQHGRCIDNAETPSIPLLGSWKEFEAKYANLTEDKFTIAIQTYKRMDGLQKTLDVLLTHTIPSLKEVVVVWNDVDTKPPENFVSAHNVQVRFRASPKNSLNQKLWMDPDFSTKAIFLSDDDVYFEPSDLEFVFQSWRKFGQNRLTGGYPRCATEDLRGKWKYSSCSRKKGRDVYSMIITGLAFSHVAFLDFYSSDDPVMTKFRQYVDDKFNCEDIALNFAASILTRSGPLLVQGHHPHYNAKPAVGISRTPGHAEARTQCLNDFAEMAGCLPLVDETAYIGRGVVRNTWLQVLGDAIGVL
ncbi:hypothetical protein K4F52_006877 [Lecanicillium sp. MT-2017a]|nr:hypothetical protein K4F52_006877 [Lecanicillium sp. MT-2017a]